VRVVYFLFILMITTTPRRNRKKNVQFVLLGNGMRVRFHFIFFFLDLIWAIRCVFVRHMRLLQ
jgi:hypothetical protein